MPTRHLLGSAFRRTEGLDCARRVVLPIIIAQVPVSGTVTGLRRLLVPLHTWSGKVTVSAYVRCYIVRRSAAARVALFCMFQQQYSIQK